MKLAILVFLQMLLCAGLAFAVDIVAHRGDNQFAPMNTVESAKHAWFNGIKHVESDFYETQDKTMVGAHCNKTVRMLSCNSDIDVLKLTEADCKNINLAANPKERAKGFDFVKLPTLEEFLWAMPPDCVLVFEAKNFSPTYADNVARAMKLTNTKPSQMVFISFKEDACVGLKKKFPMCKVYFLLGGKAFEKSAEWAVAKCKELGVDGLDVVYKDKNSTLISADYVAKVKAAGLDVWVWTVNSEDAFNYCKRIGVSAITTDFGTKFKPLR